jgi:hypothetical protein
LEHKIETKFEITGFPCSESQYKCVKANMSVYEDFIVSLVSREAKVSLGRPTLL